MNTNQIDYFLTVAELENISAASQKLYVSQPVVSRVISSLEKELEIRLFEKSGRNIRLTPFGRELYELLSKQKHEFRTLMNKYRLLENETNGQMILAYPFGWSIMPIISHLIDSFESAHPNIHLSFRSHNFVEMNDGLAKGIFDALLTIESAAPEGNVYDVIRLCELKSYILYSPNHPISKKNADPVLSDFTGSTLYYLPSSDVLNMDEILRTVFSPYNMNLNLKLEQSWQTCVANVLLGRGILLADEWSTEKSQEGFCSIEFPTPHTLVLVTKKGTPYVDDLRKHLLLAIGK